MIVAVARKQASQSSSDLAAGIIENAQQLVRLEIALAKQEAKELAITNAIAAGALAAAGIFAGLAVLVALPVLVVLLIPQHTIAAAVWLGVCLVLAVLLALFGRLRLRLELPRRTLSSLKETKEWVVHQISSSGR